MSEREKGQTVGCGAEDVQSNLLHSQSISKKKTNQRRFDMMRKIRILNHTEKRKQLPICFGPKIM